MDASGIRTLHHGRPMADLQDTQGTFDPSALLGQGPGVMLLLDPGGTVTAVAGMGSRRLAVVTVPEASLVGRPFASILPFRNGMGGEDALMQAAAHGFHSQVLWGEGDGGKRYRTEVAIHPFRSDSGALTGFVIQIAGSSLLPSRELEEAEEALEAEHLLAEAGEVFATSLDEEETARWIARLVAGRLADWALLFVVDPRGGLRLAGAACGNAEGASLAVELLEGEYRPVGRCPLGRALETGVPELITQASPGDFSFTRDDGSREEELTARSYVLAPFRGERIAGVLALVSTDPEQGYGPREMELSTLLAHRTGLALDRARLHAAARRAIHVRDEVLGMVSHDLGAPLASIAMIADRLLRRPADTDRRTESRRYLESIRGSAASMSRMIDDLLDLRRIETGRFTLVRQSEALQEILQVAMEQMRPLATERSVELVLEPPCCSVLVHADRDRLIQLLTNLLSNAIRFSPEGGVTRVRAGRRDDHAEVSVTDRGPGIPPEELSHLFDRFSRPSHPDRSGRSGLGLGLTIARRIAEAHDGAIEVESEPGKGTTFRVVLPRLVS